MKLYCPALRKILLYCIKEVVRWIRQSYIATNFICGYIGVYAVPRRVILPLKLVRGHYVLCTWAKSKEIRPISHRDIPCIHGNQPHKYVCRSKHPPHTHTPAAKTKTTRPHQHAVAQRHTTTVTTGSNMPATTYTMAQAICSDRKRVAITLYRPM